MEGEKWKKISETIYVNLKNPSISSYFTEPNRVDYAIVKLEIKESEKLNTKTIHIHRFAISKSQYLIFYH